MVVMKTADLTQDFRRVADRIIQGEMIARDFQCYQLHGIIWRD